MDNKQKDNNTKNSNSLSVILEYNELLKRPRNNNARRQLRKVINDFDDIVDIVNKIHEIDEYYDNEPESVDEKKDVKFTYIQPSKTSFLSYIFTVRSDLINYFSDKDIIMVKYFGLQFQLSYDAASTLKLIFNSAEKIILPYTARIIETGWKVMEPVKYNCFFYFHQLAKKYSHYIPLDERNIDTLTVFSETLLPEVATFFNNKQYIENLKQGILLIEGGAQNEVVTSIFQFMDRLFNQKGMSLVNIIFQVLSAKYRRVISAENIMQLHRGDTLPEDNFLMSKKIEAVVEEYTTKLEKEQSELEEKLFLLSNIKDSKPDALNPFIKKNYKGMIPEYTHDFTSWVKAFVRAFNSFSEPLLIDSVNIIEEDRKISFVLFPGLWGNHFADFNQNIKVIDETLEHVKTPVSYNKFMGFFLENKSLSSDKEEKICAHMVNIANVMYDMFVMLNKLLYDNYVLTHSANKEEVINKLDEKKKPIASIKQDKKKFLPYDTSIVAEYNKTVVDVLTDIAGILGAFLFSVQYSDVVRLSDDKIKVIDKNKNDLKKLFLLK